MGAHSFLSDHDTHSSIPGINNLYCTLRRSLVTKFIGFPIKLEGFSCQPPSRIRQPERYFAPVQVIQVATIGISRFLSPRGVSVLISEILWVWIPCKIIGIGLYATKGAIAVSFGWLTAIGIMGEPLTAHLIAISCL
jgi:hypothetical protein